MSIVIGAIVSLLIFFFERWWTAHHPIAPNAAARAEFVKQVGSRWHFWMGPKREQYAGQLFDKFVMRYAADPPVVNLSDAPCTAAEANALARKYAAGINQGERAW